MLASFRRLSKSRLGTAILVAFVVAIAISFAATDISNIAPGGFGSRGEVARVGSKSLTEQDISAAIDQQLSRLRQENPQVQRADLLRNFDQIVNGLVQEMAVTAFAERHDIALSRRLVDAEIANIPAVRGLDGRFNPQSYAAFLQQQRMTDAQLRGIISNGLLQRLVLAPGVANSRIATGVAQPYASMLLEQREGELVAVPIDLFRKDLNPNDADLRRYFAENRARYTIPEQRVIRYAVISPENVASAAATEQEIAAAYNADRAKYAPRQLRDISQAVVPDRQTAQAIATRARAGSSFAQAAAPTGLSAADVAIGVQSRDQFESLAGAEVAAAAFSANQGAIVGPHQSELGWHVVRIDAVRDEAGTPLAQVRDEIAARLTADKRKNALTDLITAIEDEVADGASFADMVAKYRLTAAQTPPLTASGVAPSDRSFRLPPAASNVLKAAFESAPDDDARVETFGQGQYALVATE